MPVVKSGPSQLRFVLAVCLGLASFACKTSTDPPRSVSDRNGLAADVAGEVAMAQADPARSGIFDTEGVERFGRLAWRFETGGAVRSSPVIAGSSLYVGSSDGALYALDGESGRKLWRYDAGSAVVSSPAIGHGFVFIGTRDNRVIAVDRQTGSAVWQVPTGPDIPWEWGHEGWDYFTSSPAVVGQKVLIGSGDGGVYALSALSGEQYWRFQTGGKVRSSPAVFDDVVYIGSADGSLYALDLDTFCTDR